MAFLTIDLIHAYHQIPVHPDYMKKTEITTPFVFFEFPFMSSGLRNAGQTFQRFMDEILREFDFCFAYIDDILVYSCSPEEHERHLRNLFRQLQAYWILLNPTKCVFRTTEVTFLGHRFSGKGSQPLPDRVADLQTCTLPQTIRQLRRFLGMIEFNGRFLPDAAATQAALHALLAGPRNKRSQTIKWTSALSQSFEECKTNLSRADMLGHPDSTAPIALVTDVSTTAMGTVLQQRKQDAWKPLEFFSNKISTAQQKYSAHDLKLLAMSKAVKHFRHMLEAQHFVIFTDHKPLTYVFSQRREKCTSRQFNHLNYISQFTTGIRHISGQDNLVADYLSRVETIYTSISPEVLAEAQATDAEHTALLQGTTALRLEKIQIPGSVVVLHCHTPTGRPRPYVPETLRRKVFDSPRSRPPRNKGKHKIHSSAIRVVGRAGLPRQGTSIPVLPAVEDIQAHHHTTGRLRSGYIPVPAPTR